MVIVNSLRSMPAEQSNLVKHLIVELEDIRNVLCDFGIKKSFDPALLNDIALKYGYEDGNKFYKDYRKVTSGKELSSDSKLFGLNIDSIIEECDNVLRSNYGVTRYGVGESLDSLTKRLLIYLLHCAKEYPIEDKISKLKKVLESNGNTNDTSALGVPIRVLFIEDNVNGVQKPGYEKYATHLKMLSTYVREICSNFNLTDTTNPELEISKKKDSLEELYNLTDSGSSNKSSGIEVTAASKLQSSYGFFTKEMFELNMNSYYNDDVSFSDNDYIYASYILATIGLVGFTTIGEHLLSSNVSESVFDKSKYKGKISRDSDFYNYMKLLYADIRSKESYVRGVVYDH